LNVTATQENGDWTEIETNGQKGWVPKSSLQDKPKDATKDKRSAINSKLKDAFGETEPEDKSSLIASKAEVAAAVKGFAKKFKAKKGMPTETELTPHFENRINWKAYVDFRKSRIADVNWFHRRRALELNYNDAPEHDPTLDATGFAIATVLAQQSGLYRDPQLLEYLNYMALFMVENSHRSEIPVQIHVLDTEEIYGFAVPGGYIFVSKGALRLMDNEAELAHFLAHEVAHLTFEHGMQEYKKRRPRIAASNAFEELDNEVQDTSNYAKVNEELTEWTDEVFDYVSKPRLDKYETEADYWGMVYTYRAGYAPEESIHYLNKMKKGGQEYAAQKGKMEWSGVPLQERIANLRSSLSKLKLSGGETYRKDFYQMKQRLN
jgi:hypothetical protein